MNWLCTCILIIGVVVVVLTVAIRAILSTGKSLKLQRAQVELLIEIARKSNVDSDVIDKIRKNAGMK